MIMMMIVVHASGWRGRRRTAQQHVVRLPVAHAYHRLHAQTHRPRLPALKLAASATLTASATTQAPQMHGAARADGIVCAFKLRHCWH